MLYFLLEKLLSILHHKTLLLIFAHWASVNLLSVSDIFFCLTNLWTEIYLLIFCLYFIKLVFYNKTVVRWGEAVSHPVRLSARVRQGSVLSPSLFSFFVNSVFCKLSKSRLGCHIKGICFNSLMYADEPLLLSLTASDLKK